jgi:hypothetical protein
MLRGFLLHGPITVHGANTILDDRIILLDPGITSMYAQSSIFNFDSFDPNDQKLVQQLTPSILLPPKVSEAKGR